VFIRGQAGQTVAAIDKFFDGKFQELILQTLQFQSAPCGADPCCPPPSKLMLDVLTPEAPRKDRGRRTSPE
jgi:hypothetical protein